MSRSIVSSSGRAVAPVFFAAAFAHCAEPGEPVEDGAAESSVLIPGVPGTHKWFIPEGGTTLGEGFPDYEHFTTYYHFVNLNSGPVTVQAYFQGEAGAWTQSLPVIPGNSRITHEFHQLTGQYGFHAAEFYSTTPHAEIRVSASRYNDGFDPEFWSASTAVNGASEARTSWFFGEGGAYAFLDHRPVFDNWFAVFNPHPAWSRVTATFYMDMGGTGTPETRVYDIAPRSRVAFNPFPTESEATVAQVRSARLDCTLSCVAQLTMYQRQFTAGRRTNTQSTFGSQLPTPAIESPGVYKWHVVGIPTDNAWHPRIYFFNPSTGNATIDLTYRDAQGQSLYWSVLGLPALRRLTYDLQEHPIPAIPDKLGGDISLEINSNQPIVLTKILYWPLGGHIWTEGANTTGHSVGGRRIVFPGGHTGAGAGGHYAYIQVMNVETSPVVIEARFIRAGSPTLSAARTLLGKGMTEFDVKAMFGDIGDFSVVIDVISGGGKIVGEAANYFGLPWRAGSTVEGIVYENVHDTVPRMP